MLYRKFGQCYFEEDILFLFINISIIIFVSVILKKIKIIFIPIYLRYCKRHLNDIEKSKWRTHRYFVHFKSRIHVKISTLNRCHNFPMDSNFPRVISTSNRWRIDNDLSIGLNIMNSKVQSKNGRLFQTPSYFSFFLDNTSHKF